MAKDDRGSRIFSDLNAAFIKDPHIDEFGFIPVVEPTQNKSPLVLIDHKLGLELWSVKILFQYSYHGLCSQRRKNSLQYGDEDLRELSRAVVLINPECALAWNIRKELILDGELRVDDDLKLGCLVLTKHPKSPETFSHRKWLLNRLKCDIKMTYIPQLNRAVNGHNGAISIDSIDVNIHVLAHSKTQDAKNCSANHSSDYLPLYYEELSICEKAASGYPSNYNAWSHRIWVVQHCFNSSTEICLSELEKSEPWVTSHVSDHSGFHYRQFLLSILSKRKSESLCIMGEPVESLLQKEKKFVQDLICKYPGHETLWYHRKYVFHSTLLCTGVVVDCKLFPRNQNGITKPHVIGSHSTERCLLKKSRLENDSLLICAKEVDLVNQMQVSSSDPLQRKLAMAYVEWVKNLYL